MFHVSFLCFNSLIINTFKGWNIELRCFIFAFNVSFSKTQWEKYKNTVGAIQKHCGSDNALPQCFEKWNMKLKMKHRSSMFQPLKALIINELKYKNETWNIKYAKVLNTYGYMFDKLQFICLIGGRVCNPRQQQVAYSRLTTLSRCSSLLLPRVKNPPPN